MEAPAACSCWAAAPRRRSSRWGSSRAGTRQAAATACAQQPPKWLALAQRLWHPSHITAYIGSYDAALTVHSKCSTRMSGAGRGTPVLLERDVVVGAHRLRHPETLRGAGVRRAQRRRGRAPDLVLAVRLLCARAGSGQRREVTYAVRMRQNDPDGELGMSVHATAP